MSKIFILIKARVLFQMSNVKNWWLSLFAKDKQTALQEPPTIIESTGMHLNLQEETIEQHTTIIDEEPEEDELVSEPLDPTYLIDTSSSIQTTIPQEQLDEDTPPIIQQEIPLLYDGKYDQYFNTPNIPVAMSYVNEELWDIITSRLRDDYVIPSNISHSLYQNK